MKGSNVFGSRDAPKLRLMREIILEPPKICERLRDMLNPKSARRQGLAEDDVQRKYSVHDSAEGGSRAVEEAKPKKLRVRSDNPASAIPLNIDDAKEVE